MESVPSDLLGEKDNGRNPLEEIEIDETVESGLIDVHFQLPTGNREYGLQDNDTGTEQSMELGAQENLFGTTTSVNNGQPISDHPSKFSFQTAHKTPKVDNPEKLTANEAILSALKGEYPEFNIFICSFSLSPKIPFAGNDPLSSS